MEKTNNKGFANLVSKMDENVKNELNSKIEGLSKKAKAAFNERCTEDYTKLSKLGSAQRINKLNNMIEDCGKEFPARAKKGAIFLRFSGRLTFKTIALKDLMPKSSRKDLRMER